jgi:hypothetical protein
MGTKCGPVAQSWLRGLDRPGRDNMVISCRLAVATGGLGKSDPLHRAFVVKNHNWTIWGTMSGDVSGMTPASRQRWPSGLQKGQSFELAGKQESIDPRSGRPGRQRFLNRPVGGGRGTKPFAGVMWDPGRIAPLSLYRGEVTPRPVVEAAVAGESSLRCRRDVANGRWLWSRPGNAESWLLFVKLCFRERLMWRDRWWQCVIVVTALAVGGAQEVQAGLYSSLGGSVADGFWVNNPAGTSLNASLNASNFMTGFVEDGDFLGIGSVTMWSGPLLLAPFDSTGQVISLTDPSWGKFQGIITEDTGEVVQNTRGGAFRAVQASGLFTPGTNAFYNSETEVMNAYMSLTFTKTSQTSVIGGGWVLETQHPHLPEPSTVILAGLGALGVAFRRWKGR